MPKLKNKTQILVVDPGRALVNQVAQICPAPGGHVLREPKLDRVLEHFETQSFDIVLISGKAYTSGGIDGIDLLEVLSAKCPATQVILLVEPQEVKLGVMAVRAGLFQYALLPIGDEELALLIETALAKQPQYAENLLLRKKRPTAEFEQMVGRSPAMQEVYRQIRQAAATDIPVLVVGETGTGKDLVAQAIHKQSPRVHGPYLPVHLGAMPPELVASELFGHEKGAFTGAVSQRKGKFEASNDGTIFIDEIGTVEERVQVSLLRIIEERKFTRLGGRRSHATNARIIAATNEDMREAVEQGNFREDLYYRLDVFRIEVPPLRERQGDVALLLDEFLRRYNQQFRKNILGVAPDLVNLLSAHEWPGNVRELKNVLQRAILVCNGDVLLPDHLPPRFRKQQRVAERVVIEVGTSLDEGERLMVLQALHSAKNRTQAAQLLGISRRALYNKLAKHGLD